MLEGGRTVFAAGLDREPLRELFLLTAKPFLYVFNVDEDELADEALRAELASLVAPAEAIFLDAKTEAELVELDDAEALELLQSIGQEESGLTQLARVGFDTLGLQTYLTAGPKESRAWTIPKGATAPEAAGVIHTDFQKGFIKAEVVSFDDLVEAGSMAEAKSARQGAHRGQGLRHARRRRRGVPLQRVIGWLRDHGARPLGQGRATMSDDKIEPRIMASSTVRPTLVVAPAAQHVPQD